MKLTYILLFSSFIFNTFAQAQNTTSHKKNKKAKDFFSLKETDTVRERHAITTAADPFPEKH